MLCVVVGRVRLDRCGCLEWIVVRLFAAMLGSGRVRVETGCLLELGWWSAPRCDGGPEAESSLVSYNSLKDIKITTF